MLSFSTAKKKKRNWREMAADDEADGGAPDTDDTDGIDEAAVERVLAEQEKEARRPQQQPFLCPAC
eukprot:SAG31_NODE_2840_length_5016_cov_15.783608_8_plen_66_part_00